MNPEQQSTQYQGHQISQESTNIVNTQTIDGTQSNPVSKIGKFKASKMLVKESLAVLRHDKELVLFPILSAITQLVVLVGLLAFVFFMIIQGGDSVFGENEQQLNVIGYIVVFIYYLITFFITNYFLAGLYSVVHGRFTGINLSFSDGLKNSNKHIGRIFVWSCISATVGMILQIISERSKIIGNIIVVLFGATWSILTYFSLPSLVIGQRTIKEAFKESASVIRKMWGETIIINFGIGLFLGLITLGVFLVMVTIIVFVPAVEILFLLGILFIIYFVAMIIVSSTLSSIVRLALYEYASTGTIPQGFTPELIKQIVQSKK